MGYKKVVAKGDAMLVVRQVQEVWKANKEELKQWLFKIKGLVKRFTKFEIWHVRREDNRRAHELAETQGEEVGYRRVGSEFGEKPKVCLSP